jgi:hypothetical protein
VDLQLVIRVLWRFKLLVVIGLLAAYGLAFYSYYNVELSGGPKITPRESEQWESLTTLFVTSKGFPWGSVSDFRDEEVANPDLPAARSTPSEVDPARMVGLSALYMELATSDVVLKEMLTTGPIDGALQAFPVVPGGNKSLDPVPMFTLSAIGPTPQQAQQLAQRHVKAFLRVLWRRQASAGIPQYQRVVVEIVRQPQPAVLLEGRKLTRPIVIFLAVMIAVFALAFVLENMRPRVRPADGGQKHGEPMVAAPGGRARLTA